MDNSSWYSSTHCKLPFREQKKNASQNKDIVMKSIFREDTGGIPWRKNTSGWFHSALKEVKYYLFWVRPLLYQRMERPVNLKTSFQVDNVFQDSKTKYYNVDQNRYSFFCLNFIFTVCNSFVGDVCFLKDRNVYSFLSIIRFYCHNIIYF